MMRLNGALRFLFYLSPWCLVFALSTEEPHIEKANNRLWKILKKNERSITPLKITKTKKSSKKINRKKYKKKKKKLNVKRRPASIDFLYTYDSAFEDQGTYYIPMRVKGNVSSNATIYYQVMGGTATKGKDYKFKKMKMNIKPGTRTAYIPIELINDHKFEIDETVKIQIIATHGIKLGQKDSFEFLILSHHVDE